MAYQATKKEVNKQSGLNVHFGYCQIQSIEKHLTRNAYCAGVSGWCCDVYNNVLDSGVNIISGYDTTRTGAIKLTVEFIEKFKNLDNEFFKMQSVKLADDYDKIKAENMAALKNLLADVYNHYN